MSERARWVVDECPDMNGHFTIRVADGTPNGNTEVPAIATVYIDERNAVLIAAAPEMYDMLVQSRKVVLNAYREVGADECRGLLVKLDTLIAKARGELK